MRCFPHHTGWNSLTRPALGSCHLSSLGFRTTEQSSEWFCSITGRLCPVHNFPCWLPLVTHEPDPLYSSSFNSSKRPQTSVSVNISANGKERRESSNSTNQPTLWFFLNIIHNVYWAKDKVNWHTTTNYHNTPAEMKNYRSLALTSRIIKTLRQLPLH